MAMSLMIEIKSLCKSFDGGQTRTVDRVSLSITSGETMVILGSSGCGKTTLLKMINRLVVPCRGQVMLDGRDTALMPLTELRRAIGYVSQKIGLFPHMTVGENIAMALRMQNLPKTQWPGCVDEMLEGVNLPPKEFLHSMPHELSGGQQQRVGVARALATGSHCLLMDEPFSALDSANRHELQEELMRIRSRFNKTIIFVTHDILEAFRLGDRIAIMHQGRLEQVGSSADIIHRPQSWFVSDLLQRTKNQVAMFHQTVAQH